jgi:hypothetical protein
MRGIVIFEIDCDPATSSGRVEDKKEDDERVCGALVLATLIALSLSCMETATLLIS